MVKALPNPSSPGGGTGGDTGDGPKYVRFRVCGVPTILQSQEQRGERGGKEEPTTEALDRTPLVGGFLLTC